MQEFVNTIPKAFTLISTREHWKTLEGIGITTDNDMANMMNNYLISSVFTIEQRNNVTQLSQYEGNIFETFDFSNEEVHEKLQHLNILYNSTGPDMLTLGFSMYESTNLLNLSHTLSRNRNYT